MSNIVPLSKDKYRLFVATQYLNASAAIYEGLKRQRGVNNFHFLVSVRSFIEYTRRGIWFLMWANAEKLQEATKLTFERPGSPNLVKMDSMINEKLGNGRQSALERNAPGIKEPFIDCLHALTHGNPICVRMIAHGLEKSFDIAGLTFRAEADLNIFKILLYRRMLGESPKSIWQMLTTMHNRPDELTANARIAAQLLKNSGKFDEAFFRK